MNFALVNVIFCGTKKLEYLKTRDLLDYLLWLFYPKVTFKNLERKTIVEALTLNLVPKTYRRYVDDTQHFK